MNLDTDMRIQNCIKRYLQKRAEHITAWKQEGRFIPFSDMEICWLEAGEILFEMLNVPGLPTKEEVGEPGRKPKSDKTQDESPVSGFVYLLRNHRNGFVKIGWSTNPAYREGTLQSEEPDVSMIAKTACFRSLEKALHERFAAQRVRGEWFHLQKEQVKTLIAEFEGVA